MMKIGYWVPFTKKFTKTEQEYYNHLVNGLNDQLDLTREWLLSDEAKKLFEIRAEELKEYLNHSKLLTNLNKIIKSNAKSSEEYIQKFYEQGAKKGCTDIQRKLHFTNADKEALYHLKNYNFDLITNMGDDMKYSIRETLTSAIIEEGSIRSIREQLQELPLKPTNNNISPENRARMIARTENSRARNKGTIQAYKNYGVEEVDILTAGDELVCDDCLDLEAKNPHPIEEMEDKVPVHPNCRCTLTAHISDSEELPEEPIPEEETDLENINPLEIGEQGTITETFEIEGKTVPKTIEYPDGTIIHYNTNRLGNYILESLEYNGKTINYMGENCYEMFSNTDAKRSKEESKWLEKWHAKYSVTDEGWKLNIALRDDDLKGYCEKPTSKIPYDWIMKQIKFLKNSSLANDSNKPYLSLRLQEEDYSGDTFNINKSFVSSTVGSSFKELSKIIPDAKYGGCWKYVTIINPTDKGGCFMGNILKNVRADDFESELTWCPNKKFKILIKDVRNKLIIQIPIRK